jgi:thiol-disulfide isomerase/thioredoxin
MGLTKGARVSNLLPMFSARARRQAPWAPILPLVCGCAAMVPGGGHPAAAAPAADKAASSGQDQTPPPGIDISKLGDFERKVFFRVVNREPSACGKGHSLLHSAKLDPSCRASFYAVRYVAHLVDSAFTDSEISERLEQRFRTPRVRHFDLTAAPSKGSVSGRVTLVEFVDYGCPHCRHAQDLLHQLLEEYPKDVRLFFKHFPLSGHTNARLAAEEAVAAHKQGRFWAFNEKVWAHPDSLTSAGLEKLAKEIPGLDFARWRRDANSAAVKDRVEADRSEGDDLGINGTPTLYINGRKYVDPLDIASLKDWIDEELGR